MPFISAAWPGKVQTSGQLPDSAGAVISIVPDSPPPRIPGARARL